jgi:L-lactate dehydrogenase complex protein LldF
VYGGPIGAVLTPLLVGFEKAGDLPFASSLCAACTEVCPVRIPLHEHLIALRRDVMAKERPAVQASLFRLWAVAWRTPVRFRLFIRLSRLAQRVLVRRGRIRRAPFPLSRWTGGRDLPPVARETFRERWVVRRRAGQPDANEEAV